MNSLVAKKEMGLMLRSGLRIGQLKFGSLRVCLVQNSEVRIQDLVGFRISIVEVIVKTYKL